MYFFVALDPRKVWSQSCSRGGPVVSHHPTDSLTAGWLGGLGPAKESRSGARQAKVQVEGIAYSFCGLWISSVLACLCVTSQLNGPWFDSRWSLRLMGSDKRATKKPWPTLAWQACHGVKVWGKASQSCYGGPVVSHHPTESQSCSRGGPLVRPHQTERPPGIEPGAVELS